MSFKSTFSFCLLFPFLIATSMAQSSSPYTTKVGKDATILGAGLLLTGTTIYLGRRVVPLTLDQINSLNSSQIPAYDRYATRLYSKRAHQFSNITGLASLAFPNILLWKERNNGNQGKLFLIAVEGAALTMGLTNLTKMLTKRTRPYVYNDAVPLAIKMEKNARYSFFSGHASMSAYFAFSGAQMYSDLYPNSNKKALVWATAAALPLMTSYARVRAGKHFPTDVLVGYAVGALFGVLLPRLHRF